MMTRRDAPTVDAFFTHLMAISRDAAAAGHFEVAYHALAGALHAAQDADEAAKLLEVEATVRAVLAMIDTTAPAHPLSSASTTARTDRPPRANLFAMLARQASTQATLARTRRAHERRESAHK
jgi:hypothetical protein